MEAKNRLFVLLTGISGIPEETLVNEERQSHAQHIWGGQGSEEVTHFVSLNGLETWLGTNADDAFILQPI